MSSRDIRLSFGTADYVMLGIMLLGSMSIGLFFAVCGKSQMTNLEYLLGGRRLKALPVCMSLFATFMSAISLIGIPTEIYSYGTMYMYCLIGQVLSYIVATVTLIPLMYPLRVTSVYEYLNLRFKSRTVQLLGAAFGVMTTLSYMTIALLSPALALETAVGIPLWLSIILVGAVGTVYTTLGGMKSVIWTDVFQTFVIFAGIFTVIIKGTMDAGGMDKVWQTSKDTGRIDFSDISFDPRVRHTVWNLSIGLTFYWLANHFTQSSVQRLVSTRSIQDARNVYFFTIPLIVVFISVLCVTGLVLLAYFNEIGCDPLAAGFVKNKNQLVPYFVIHTLSFLPGLSGLYIATIFSGALSTLSSGINSLAANTVQDFLPWFLRYKSEVFVTSVTKTLVCFFGMASTGLAYLAKNFEGPVIQVGYTAIAASNGPLLGLFLLGGLFPQANSSGATVGFLSSIVLSFWQAIGSLRFRYATPVLPLGPTDNCGAPGNISSLFSSTPTYTFTTNNSTDFTTFLNYSTVQGSDRFEMGERDFSFYDVSYVWAPVTGAVMTIVFGLVTSLVSNCFSAEIVRPEAKLLFAFCRKFWYSQRDVLSVQIKLRDHPVNHQ
ncbi:sodium-coupled monocarboxylate transporter 1 [Elysia marginata]|uniref:Sodium-coupled monocarboxylate transporter 1 n=1 Tax=Elysia marginata TaxID=1093978 RepID=A0AAV4JQ38_9GAST|nr:sodium-coupled monocarboxylate transporter 1 [Elysia marginata]